MSSSLVFIGRCAARGIAAAIKGRHKRASWGDSMVTMYRPLDMSSVKQTKYYICLLLFRVECLLMCMMRYFGLMV